jgi:hypothetical protein
LGVDIVQPLQHAKRTLVLAVPDTGHPWKRSSILFRDKNGRCMSGFPVTTARFVWWGGGAGRPTHRLASRMSRFIVVMVGSLNASPSSIMYLLRHTIKRTGSQKRR